MDWKEELQETVDEAAGDKTGEERREAVWQALKKHLPSDIRQLIFDKGHESATGKLKDEVETLRKERDGLSDQLDTARTTIAELEERELPDDASEREKELAQRIDELQSDLEKQRKEAEAERNRLAEERRKTRIDSLKSKIRTKATKLDEPWLELQLINDSERFDVDGDNPIIRQRGRTSPISADNADELADAYVSELLSRAPDERIKSGVDAGGGAQGGGSGSGKWDSIRERAKTPASGTDSEANKRRLQGMT